MKPFAIALLLVMLLTLFFACGPLPAESDDEPTEEAEVTVPESEPSEEADESDSESERTGNESGFISGWVTEDWGDGPIDVYYGLGDGF